jgi:phosphate transport system substrate-binding protein
MICEGQQQAAALGYSPLPMNLVQAASDVIQKIPGTVGGVDFNACNNPTFKPGDSPSNNQLAATAPMPADCDMKGPNQCATGTAGALEETPVTGTGGSGQATSGSGAVSGDAAAAGGDAAAAAAAAAGGGGDAVYDANGNLVSGSSASGGSAVSSPFTLASDGWGTPQIIMLVAGVLLFVAVVVPPLVSRRLRGSRSDSK